MPKLKSLEEIKRESIEPKYDYIKKSVKIIDNKRDMLIRIPKEIKDFFKLKGGYEVVFYSKIKEPKLEIKILKDDRQL